MEDGLQCTLTLTRCSAHPRLRDADLQEDRVVTNRLVPGEVGLGKLCNTHVIDANKSDIVSPVFSW